MAKDSRQNRPYQTSKKFFDISVSQILSSNSYVRNDFVTNVNFDYSAMQQGIDWFEMGKTIGEVEKLDKDSELYQKFNDKDFKNSFITGFNIAERKKMIAEIERKNGAKFYSQGGLIELLTEEQKKKMLTDNFLLGYEEAKIASWNEVQNNIGKNR